MELRRPNAGRPKFCWFLPKFIRRTVASLSGSPADLASVYGPVSPKKHENRGHRSMDLRRPNAGSPKFCWFLRVSIRWSVLEEGLSVGVNKRNYDKVGEVQRFRGEGLPFVSGGKLDEEVDQVTLWLLTVRRRKETLTVTVRQVTKKVSRSRTRKEYVTRPVYHPRSYIFTNTHTPLPLTNFSPLIHFRLLRYPLPPLHLVCEMISPSPDLGLSLSLYRYPYVYIPT
jgi:hypothetical protein